MPKSNAKTTTEVNLDPSVVLATLYERVTRDVLDSQKYLSVTDIIGVLEMIKLSMFMAAHIQASQAISKAAQGGMKEC